MLAFELFFSLFQSSGVKGWKVVLRKAARLHPLCAHAAFQRRQFSQYVGQELSVGLQEHAAVDLLLEDGLRRRRLGGAPHRLRLRPQLVGVEVLVQAAEDVGQGPAAIADGGKLAQQRAGGRLQVALLHVHPSQMWEEGLQVCGDARHPLRRLQAGDVGVGNVAQRRLAEELKLSSQRRFLQQIKDDEKRKLRFSGISGISGLRSRRTC